MEHFTILEFSFITLAFLIGLLIGLYLSLSALKGALGINQKTKRNKSIRRDPSAKEKEENIATKESSNSANRTNDDDTATADKNTEKPKNEKTEDEHYFVNTDSINTESQYSEGGVLAQKLKRDDFSMFDYCSAADGVDPQVRLREKQSREDASYSVLKTPKE